MSSLSIRSLGRRRVAAIALAFAAFGGFAAYRTQAAAQAHLTEVSLGMSCDLGGGNAIGIQVAYGIEHEPAVPVAGEAFTITTDSTVAIDPNAPDLPVTGMAITIPVPFGVVGGGSIEASGGNLTKSGQQSTAAGTVVSFSANPGVTSKSIQVPQLVIPVTIAEEVPEQIVFEGPSRIELTLSINGTPLPIACTADDNNPPLLTVSPTGGTIVAAPTTTKKPSTGGGSTGGGEGDKPKAVKASPRYTG